MIPLNTWYNVIVTSDGTQARVYMNGVHDVAADFQVTFTWPAVDDPWYWCNSRYPPAGSLKIANVKFSPVAYGKIILF